MKKLFENWREHTIEEKAELKIPVERYDAFKRKIEQWAMLYGKFTRYTDDLNHETFDRKTHGRRLRKAAIKLEQQLRKILNEFDMEYKSYDDERYAMRQKLDSFDGDDEMFMGGVNPVGEGVENITPENVQIAADAIRQVVANLAPAAILPAMMLVYKEYKDKKQK